MSRKELATMHGTGQNVGGSECWEDVRAPGCQGHGETTEKARQYTYPGNNSTVPRFMTPYSDVLRPLPESSRLIQDMGGLTLEEISLESGCEYAISTERSPRLFSLSPPLALKLPGLSELKDGMNDPNKLEYNACNLRNPTEQNALSKGGNILLTKTKHYDTASQLRIKLEPKTTIPQLDPLDPVVPHGSFQRKQTLLSLPEESGYDLGQAKTCASSGLRNRQETPAAAQSTPETESEDTGETECESTTKSVVGTGCWMSENDANVRPSKIEDFSDILALENIPEREVKFDQSWKTGVKECPGGRGQGHQVPQRNVSQKSDSSGSKESAMGSSKDGDKGQKRSAGGRGGGDDRRNPKDSKRSRSDPKGDLGAGRRLACPYHQHDPWYYRTSPQHGEKYMVCAAGIGFESSARVKEHLKRVHALPPACVRCGRHFQGQADLDTHQRTPDSCPVLPKSPQMGMTPEVKARVLARTPNKDATEEEKWFDIYHVLFPDELSPAAGAYRDYFDQVSPGHAHTCSNLDGEWTYVIEKRLDNIFKKFTGGHDWRERLRRLVISEVHASLEESFPSCQAMPILSSDVDNLPTQMPSTGSYTDSAHSLSSLLTPSAPSSCDVSECPGCPWCIPMGTPSRGPSHESVPPESPFAPNYAVDGSIHPTFPKNTTPKVGLHSTGDMDKFIDSLDPQFREQEPGANFFHGNFP